MQLTSNYILMSILIVAGVTLIIRALPFIIFGKNKTVSPMITYLGNHLPYAVMTMLVIYSLRYTTVAEYPFAIPEILGVITVIGLHLYKRHHLLSILGGTAVYMFAVQVLFT